MTLRIYRGSTLICLLLDAASRTSGAKLETWDGRDDAGAVVPDGQYTFKIDAADAAGNAASQQATVTIDTVAPGLTLSAPSGPTRDSAPSLAGMRGQAGGDEPLVTIQLYAGASVDPARLLQTLTASAGGAGYSINPAGLSDGAYTATAAQSDAAGNTGVGSTTFTVDTVAPTVTINQAAGQVDPATGGPVHFTVVFSEPVSGFEGRRHRLRRQHGPRNAARQRLRLGQHV